MRIFDTDRLNFDSVLLGDDAITADTIDEHTGLSNDGSFHFHHLMLDRLSDVEIIQYFAKVREVVDAKAGNTVESPRRRNLTMSPSKTPRSPGAGGVDAWRTGGKSPRSPGAGGVDSSPDTPRVDRHKIDNFTMSQTHFRYCKCIGELANLLLLMYVAVAQT